jgi:hypothetical protein
MPGRQPRKVDCAGGSSASDVAAVVVLIFGHVDGEERTLGDSGVGGVTASAAPRSCVDSLIRGQRVPLPSWGFCGYLS